ncbi:hypothetical protein Tco_1082227 [Tanacetum coccineum]|uniref:Uncharacterized protein n=1 Tax=Tanacetum coccineum TaxID=301880 RepID=A0ABQ5I1Y7_9ASTR
MVDRYNVDVSIVSLWTSTSHHHHAGVAGSGSAKDHPNVNSNFRPRWYPVFDGCYISIPRKVLKRLLFFKFYSQAGLEAFWRVVLIDFVNSDLSKEMVPDGTLIAQRRIDSYSDMVVSPPIVATFNVVTPNAEKTNDGFQMVGKTKKRKTTGNSSKKDNLFMSNSFSALNEEEEEEEDVKNVYDESANLL